MPSILKKTLQSILSRVLKEGLDSIFKRKPKDSKGKEGPSSKEESKSSSNKNHPWRLCPAGKSWVVTHPLTIPASNTGSEYKTTRGGHCRLNPGGREVYTAEELVEIEKQNFDMILNDPNVMPIPDDLGFPNGNKYDRLIAGWTKFWNEIFKPEDPVTPDFIKALIATESSFILPKDQKSNEGPARAEDHVGRSRRRIQGYFSSNRQEQKRRRNNDKIKSLSQAIERSAQIIFVIFCMGFMSVGCFSWPQKQSNLRLQSASASPVVVIHKRTSNFVDIETPVEQLWFGCSGDASEDIAFIGFSVLDGKILWDFFYRRPLTTSQCRDEVLEYQ
ncbi:MAG: hypothetical protein AABZ31_15160, partial [Bdellovibrionota bacterium]